MGRPTLHNPDTLLDAAVAVVARSGVRALTVAAVGREAKAPSGTLYNRYPDRASLLAAVWLRTVRRYQQGYRDFVTDDPTPQRAIEGAGWTVEWCRSHVEQAVVLEAGPQGFDPRTWPEAARSEWAQIGREQSTVMAALAHAVAERAGCSAAEAAFAMFELPLAVVRSDLQAGTRPPERAVAFARLLAERIILRR